MKLGYSKKFTAMFASLILIALSACSSGYVDPDDWSEFDTVVKKISKNELACGDFLSLRVVREGTKWNDRYFDGVLDYIYKKDPELHVCRDELKTEVKDYCSARLNRAVGSLTDSYYGNKPSRKYLSFCKEDLKQALKEISTKYSTPTDDSDFIIIEDKGVMIRPMDIKKITFREDFPGSLWRLELHLEEGVIDLFFGNKELFLEARKQLSKTKHRTANNRGNSEAM